MRERIGDWRGLWLLLGLLVLAAAPARAQEVAAQVAVAVGEVVAVAPDGAERALARRSPLHVGESIRTGVASRTQLRFADGAIVSLREDSELRIDAFRFVNNGGPGDTALMTLVKGGFRTITGAIGKSNPAAYQVTTAVATIGIRGTFYEASLGDGLGVGVWQGGVRVENAAGGINLGDGAEYDFAFVAGPDRPPQGLLIPPPRIGGSDSAQEAEGAGEAAPATEQDDPGPPPTGLFDRQDGPSGGVGLTSLGVAGAQDPLQPDPDSVAESLSLNLPSDPTPEPPLDGAPDLPSDPSPEPPPNGGPELPLTHARLTDTEQAALDANLAEHRYGMAVIGGASGGQLLAPGYALKDGGDSFFYAGYAGDPGDTGYPSGGATVIIEPENVGLYTPDPWLGVEWGVWQVDADGVLAVYGDPSDASQRVNVREDLYWITGQASTPEQIASVTGTVDFDSRDFLGTSHLGNLEWIEMGVSIEFDGGLASVRGGSFSVGTGGGTFQAALSGTVNRNFLALQFDDAMFIGELDASPASGAASGFFVPNGSDPVGGVVGGFYIEAPEAEAHAQGVFLLER